MKKILLFLFLFILVNQTVNAGDSCFPSCQIEPPCCSNILKQLQEKGDISGLPDEEQPYHACDWNENDAKTNDRAFCRRSTCDQLPTGVKYRGHCGWYWNFHDPYTQTGYGCQIGPDEAHMTPICNAQSSSNSIAVTPQPPEPTEPQPSPTSTPTQEPLPTGEPLLPTENPLPLSTLPPARSTYFDINQNYSPISTVAPAESFQLPQFSIPLVQIPTIPMTCSIAPSANDPISYIFDKVTFYDRTLENNLNIRLILLYHSLRAKMGL